MNEFALFAGGGGGILGATLLGWRTVAAAKLNRHFLGIELNPEYIKIAERRIAGEVAQGKFF